MKNPKIIHRIYFENFAPFHDPYEHYLESWYREMPDYKIMKWGYKNLDVSQSDWTQLAAKNNAPVFLSEYFRWQILSEYGGLYLDADCEIIDGKVLSGLLDDLYEQDEYDVFFGVEERSNGYPTAQTIAAKKEAGLISFMKNLYEERLSPLWKWRESRGLIGPQLISLFYQNEGSEAENGYFRNLDEPIITQCAKVYPQHYFSPKFTLLGESVDYREGKTCVYHMFANANVDFSKNQKMNNARQKAMTFSEYRLFIEEKEKFPRVYDSSHFSIANGIFTDTGIISTGNDGMVFYGPYFSLPRGQYSAVLHFNKLPSTGMCNVSVTCRSGKVKIADGTFDLSDVSGKSITMIFNIFDEIEHDIEIVLTTSQVPLLEFDKLLVDKLEEKIIPGFIPKVESVIPNTLKKIHRVYFGFDGKPDGYLRYLDTWREQLPDFQILHWNASNLPMDINPYVQKLYEEKDHAFLTDFFRWYLLREYGGSYLDADVEIINGDIYRSIIDDLENSANVDAVIGIDEKGGGWYTAHSMASKPNSDIATFMCSLYEGFGSFTAWRKKGFYFWAPQLTALYFANRNHNIAGMGTSPNIEEPIVVSGVKIYPQEWFAPLSPSGQANKPFLLNALTTNSCLCHHFACSWHDDDSIYLAHSKSSGGQNNTLLREIVQKESNQYIPASSPMLRTMAGTQDETGIHTSGKDGILLYGPYLHLPAGAYTVDITFSDIQCIEGAKVDIVANQGDVIILPWTDLSEYLVKDVAQIVFQIDNDMNNVEARIIVSELNYLSVSSVRFKR